MTNNTLSLKIYQGVKMKTKFKCACGTTTRYTEKDAKKETSGKARIKPNVKTANSIKK